MPHWGSRHSPLPKEMPPTRKTKLPSQGQGAGF